MTWKIVRLVSPTESRSFATEAFVVLAGAAYISQEEAQRACEMLSEFYKDRVYIFIEEPESEGS